MGEAWCRNVLDAIQKGDSVTLDKLLKSAGKQRLNLRIRTTNYRFFSPVHYAVGRQKYEIVKQLLLAGATFDGPDIYGNAPLMVAAASCDKEMCNLLLKHGANVYASNKYHSGTAMDYAVHYNNVEAVTAFLQHAAENPSKAAIKMIRSGLRGAAFGGYPSILNLFSDHCGNFSIMIPLKLLLDDAIHKHNLHQGVNGREECAIFGINTIRPGFLAGN